MTHEKRSAKIVVDGRWVRKTQFRTTINWPLRRMVNVSQKSIEFHEHFRFGLEKVSRKTFDATWSFQLNEKLKFARVKDEVKWVYQSLSWPCQVPCLQISNWMNMYDCIRSISVLTKLTSPVIQLADYIQYIACTWAVECTRSSAELPFVLFYGYLVSCVGFWLACTTNIHGKNADDITGAFLLASACHIFRQFPHSVPEWQTHENATIQCIRQLGVWLVTIHLNLWLWNKTQDLYADIKFNSFYFDIFFMCARECTKSV